MFIVSTYSIDKVLFSPCPIKQSLGCQAQCLKRLTNSNDTFKNMAIKLSTKSKDVSLNVLKISKLSEEYGCTHFKNSNVMKIVLMNRALIVRCHNKRGLDEQSGLEGL